MVVTKAALPLLRSGRDGRLGGGEKNEKSVRLIAIARAAVTVAASFLSGGL
jgi:hypothetical protein